MKHSLALFIAFMLLSGSCSQKKKISFTVKGKVLNATQSTKIHFSDDKAGDSPLNPDGSFEYKGTVYFPGIVLFRTDSSYPSYLWINGGDISLTLEEYYSPGKNSTGKKRLKIVSVSGHEETEKHEEFSAQWDTLLRKYSHISMPGRSDSVLTTFYPLIADYLSKHPRSALSASIIGQYPFTIEQKQHLVSLLDHTVNTERIKNVEEDIKRAALLKPGTVIPDLKQETIDGSLFSLYSLQADYILLEFWASNCLPCRASNPSLKNIYDKYHPKGFEIVGISLDMKKKAWEEAVEKDKLPWIQVSDLKGSKNSIASAYLVNAIPYNILLNKNHEVIATNLPLQALADKLKELL